MDLMAYVPYFHSETSAERVPIIIHNCEQIKEKDELKSYIKGTSYGARLKRWFLRQRILSRKHPLTRWCLNSTTAVNYEITRHLRTYPYMIHPFSPIRVVWETVMTLFSFVALLITPVFLTFYFKRHLEWHILNNAINFIFMCDVVIWFFTGYYDYRTKVIVLDPKIVALKYFKGYFVLDVLPVLPMELIDILTHSLWASVAVNMMKALKISTIILYGRRLRDVYSIDFQVYKILQMAVIIIMSVHWSACLEYFVPLSVAVLSTTSNESWIESDYLAQKTTKLQQYLTCVNRATTSLVQSGHYLDMKTPEDIILNLILTMVGFLGFIYLLAQFSQLMVTFNSTAKSHLRIIRQLQEYMRYKELPRPLQRRLLIFYNYRSKKGFNRDRKIIRQVSPYLREKLILHNHLNLLSSIELFRHLPETVISQLAAALRSEVFIADDEIIKAGTPGEALYFIASGTVAVYNAAGKEVCHLEDDAYFGEIALVMESEHSVVTIIAVETCEVYMLHRNDFQRYVTPYPDLLKHLQNFALHQLEKTLLPDEVYKLRRSTTPQHINISSIKGKYKPKM